MSVVTGAAADPVLLIISGIICIALSGVPGLVPRLTPVNGQRLATLLAMGGAVPGLTGAMLVLLAPRTEAFTLNWTLPFGPCELALDPLAALFLIPVFLVTAATALYANGYWPATSHPTSSRRLGFFAGLLSAAMALLLMARNSVLFLMAWEVMALAAWFVMVAEDRDRDVRRAGTLYLLCTHTGTMALLVMFIMLRNLTGSFLLPAAGTISPALAGSTAVFIAALAGFGVKAGIMPFHIWLPAAHANGPSHISAIMSGVMLKMGIYGILRIISCFAPLPLGWGFLLLTAGTLSALVGVACALGQHDLKRLLAYSSIENIGIILMGTGVAAIGLASNLPSVAMLGMTGALLHLLNHALFKPLLFLGAGSVIHATGTRDLNRMGGLARRMPATSLLFAAGTLALCALPPFNGFVSEFLIYLGIFTGVRECPPLPLAGLVLAASTLAMVGALALAAFAKVYGTAFCGLPRSPEADNAHESERSILVPMGVLALLCLAIGLFPAGPVRLITPAVLTLFPALVATPKAVVDPAIPGWLSLAAAALLAMALLLAIHYRRRLVATTTATAPTWGCGYLSPSVRMQYTASSFAELLVKLLRAPLLPRQDVVPAHGTFPPTGRFASRVPETLMEQGIVPLCRLAQLLFSLFRRVQHGELQLYVLYIFVTLAALLVWGY